GGASRRGQPSRRVPCPPLLNHPFAFPGRYEVEFSHPMPGPPLGEMFMSERNRNFTARFPSPPTLRVPLGQRVRNAALLWVLLGAAVGAIMAPHRDSGGVSAGAFAGVILLLPLGAAVGLAGARVKPALVGALSGAAVGTLTGVLLCPAGVPAVLS